MFLFLIVIVCIGHLDFATSFAPKLAKQLTAKRRANKFSTAIRIKPGISFDIQLQDNPSGCKYSPNWPNPADFRFNYHNLLKATTKTGIAQVNGQHDMSVAIIGAGVAGMTAARELLRSGFNVTIFEASDRIGGRLYTLGNPNGATEPGMELGAMRMPFFNNTDSDNSVLQYYTKTEPLANGFGGLIHSPIPNPGQTPNGSSGIAGTGIYVNNGRGPQIGSDFAYESPTLIPWAKHSSPSNQYLSDLKQQVDDFVNDFTSFAAPLYVEESNVWTEVWAKIVRHYDSMTFHDLVMTPRRKLGEIDICNFDGDVGGFGMDMDQADMLYTIGIGDGSWGAFYSISALWFMRCTFFGFSTNLQTVEQYENAEKFEFFNQTVYDSNGKELPKPLFEGIQSLVEYLYYVAAGDGTPSLHSSDKAELYIDRSVSEIRYLDYTRRNGAWEGVEVTDKSGISRNFTFALVTATSSRAQLSMKFTGFDEKALPQKKQTATSTQHFISSCKLFFPLHTKYWKMKDNRIPQVIITDTHVQDTYGLEWSNKPADSGGVLLASYSWEDASLKFSPFNSTEMADIVLSKLDEITLSTVGQAISKYVDKSKPVQFQWLTQPTYIGCAKLYRAYAERNNYLDLSYNQNNAMHSHLFFAGEMYGVEGGWTEPALRSALDAVIQLNKIAGSVFSPAFNPYSMYPVWQNWSAVANYGTDSIEMPGDSAPIKIGDKLWRWCNDKPKEALPTSSSTTKEFMSLQPNVNGVITFDYGLMNKTAYL